MGSSHGLRVHRKRLKNALFGLAFASPPLPVRLAAYGDSRTHYAKGKRSRPEGRSHSLWTHDFRSVSLPSTGFFSPFPRGTGSLSVVMEYLGLEGGPPGFGRSFTCSALLGIPVGPVGFSAMGLSPAAALLSSSVRLTVPVPCPGPATPGSELPGLGSCAFARRYSRNVV